MLSSQKVPELQSAEDAPDFWLRIVYKEQVLETLRDEEGDAAAGRPSGRRIWALAKRVQGAVARHHGLDGIVAVVLFRARFEPIGAERGE